MKAIFWMHLEFKSIVGEGLGRKREKGNNKKENDIRRGIREKERKRDRGNNKKEREKEGQMEQ